MSLSKSDLNKLRKIISLAESLLKSSGSKSASKAAKATKSKKSGVVRKRRSGAELKAFRQQIIADRKTGVSAAELSKKYGVSMAYIYQL